MKHTEYVVENVGGKFVVYIGDFGILPDQSNVLSSHDRAGEAAVAIQRYRAADARRAKFNSFSTTIAPDR